MGRMGRCRAKGGIGFIDRFITELGYEPQQGYRIPADARKRWESMGLRPEQWELFGRATSDEHLSYLESVAFMNQMADDDRRSSAWADRSPSASPTRWQPASISPRAAWGTQPRPDASPTRCVPVYRLRAPPR